MFNKFKIEPVGLPIINSYKSMEYTFTKEDIITSIEYLDKHPEEFVGRGSFHYDLSYNNPLCIML